MSSNPSPSEGRAARIGALARELLLRRKSELLYRAWFALKKRTGALQRAYPSRVVDLQDIVRADLQALTPERMLEAVEVESAACFPGALSVLDCLTLPAPMVRRAKVAARDRFEIFGRVVDGLHWRALIGAEGEWPLVHWTEVRFKGTAGVDVKDCWELNRHQAWVALGLAWRAGHDADYATAFVRQLRSWCEQNPPEMGVNYASNLELGLRSLSWIWADHLFRNAPNYTPADRRLLHVRLHGMARHLHQNLPYTEWTGRNNHLVGDAACLAVAASLNPSWQESARWRRRAAAVLFDALPRQLLADGMHFELSPGYHLFVLQFALLAAACLEKAGEAIPTPFRDAIDRMTRCLRRLVTPDGDLPDLNDGDDGVAAGFAADRRGHLGWTLALADSILGIATEAPEARLVHALVRPPAPEASEAHGPERIEHLVDAGLIIGRSPDVYWLLDAHRDPFPDSGHNHASLLQFQCRIDAHWLISDSGTFRYNGSASIRNQLRSSDAHSVLLADGGGQARPARDFGWTALNPRAEHRILQQDGFAVAAASFDAIVAAGHVRLGRAVWWPQSRHPLLAILDVASNASGHAFCTQWQLGPEVECEMAGAGRAMVGWDATRLAIAWPGHDQGELVRTPYSPSYGQLIERWCLRRTWQPASGVAHRWTVIGPPMIELTIDDAGALVLPAQSVRLVAITSTRIPDIGVEAL